MTQSWEDHQRLLAELHQQRIERETREAQERQEAAEAPLREQALELAKVPVDLTRYRNERNLMMFPFCSTAKAKRVKSIRYTSADGKRWLEVTANYEYGMAKIWDFDILRFALSKAGEVALQVGYFPPCIEFTAYECLKAIGRDAKAGKNYIWIDDQEKMDEIFSIIHKQSGGLRLAPIPTIMDDSSYLIFKPTLKNSNDIEITEIYLQNNILNINVKPLENPDLRAGSRISPNVLVKILKKITDKKITINYK